MTSPQMRDFWRTKELNLRLHWSRGKNKGGWVTGSCPGSVEASGFTDFTGLDQPKVDAWGCNV